MNELVVQRKRIDRPWVFARPESVDGGLDFRWHVAGGRQVLKLVGRCRDVG